MTTTQSIIDAQSIRYRYPGSAFAIQVPSFQAAAGERVAITGPSGCGKTTLLRVITGLLTPESGTVRVRGADLSGLSESEKRRLRVRSIGSIAQELDLLEHLCVEENILLPFFVSRAIKLTRNERRELKRLAEALGLADKLKRFPHELSQGERQRVAIARALITRPEILAADEPTGNLDGGTARQVLQLIGDLIQERGTTLIMVTHDLTLLDFFDRRFELGEGSQDAAA